MASTGKSAAALAIVLGLWALLMAGSMTFSAFAPPALEVQAHKLPASAPAEQTIEERCACIFEGGDCQESAPTTS
jgi:hypothetical protein